MDAALAEPPQVIDLLAQRRAERQSRLTRIAALAPLHPALRWYANGDTAVAHRRRRDGDRTCCGLLAVALVIVTEPGVPDCEDCAE